jgi:hypothetical protein
MRLSRTTSLIVFGVVSVLLYGSDSRGQAPADVVNILKPYKKELDLGPQTGARIRQMMTAQIRILKTPDEKKNLDALDEFARYFAAKVTQEKYYNSGSESGEMKARPQDDNFDSVFNEIRGSLVRPTAENVSKMTVDNADYIKELGAAFDRALVPLLKIDDPRASLIRVNAARMFAVVSETGAPALGKTIIALLNDPKTPPEVLLSTYVAAEGYLAAYDAYAVGRVDANRHSGEPADIISLVQSLERHVIFPREMPYGPVAEKVFRSVPSPAQPAANGAAPVAGQQPTAAKLETTGLTPEQVAVVRYFRRHAVRALAKVRFDILGGKSNLPEVRPAFTLARVAIGDAAVSPQPSAAEYADAVIGLCGMNLSPQTNVDVLTEAMAGGVVGFAIPKNQNGEDRSIPWRLYAIRLGSAFNDFKASINKNPTAFAGKAQITSLTDAVFSSVVSRLERAEGETRIGPDVERLRGWIQQNAKDPNRQLFNDTPSYRLNPKPL